MNRQRNSFVLSLLIHGVLLVSIYVVSSSCAQTNPPIVIDFSITGTAGPGSGEANPPAGQSAPKAAVLPRLTPSLARAVTRSGPVKTPLPVKEQVVKTAVEQNGPAAIIESPKTGTFVAAKSESSGTQGAADRTGGASGPGVSGASSGAGSAKGTSLGGGKTSDGPQGGGGLSAEQLRNRYLKEHFAYIRDLIQRNISYPPRARKMGWTGKVVISFIVHETGRVSNEKVVSSSGFELLDNNVITTIKAVAPFPQPPVKAELRVPIVYRLE